MFIPISEARQLLGIGQPQMQNILPLLPHIYVVTPQSHLLPRGYIEAYARHLGRQNSRATKTNAIAFWSTSEAQTLVSQAKKVLASAVGLRREFKVSEVAKLLGLSTRTVVRWHNNGIFTQQKRVQYEPGRDYGKPRQVRLIISSQEIREALEWKIPKKPRGWSRHYS